MKARLRTYGGVATLAKAYSLSAPLADSWKTKKGRTGGLHAPPEAVVALGTPTGKALAAVLAR